MQTNVGGVDRVVRFVLGVAIIAVGIAYGSWWGLIGIVPLVTGLVGWCLLYRVLKMSGARRPPTPDPGRTDTLEGPAE